MSANCCGISLAVQKSQANRNVFQDAEDGCISLAVQKSQANRNGRHVHDDADTSLAVQKSQANRNDLDKDMSSYKA